MFQGRDINNQLHHVLATAVVLQHCTWFCGGLRVFLAREHLCMCTPCLSLGMAAGPRSVLDLPRPHHHCTDWVNRVQTLTMCICIVLPASFPDRLDLFPAVRLDPASSGCAVVLHWCFWRSQLSRLWQHLACTDNRLPWRMYTVCMQAVASQSVSGQSTGHTAVAV